MNGGKVKKITISPNNSNIDINNKSINRTDSNINIKKIDKTDVKRSKSINIFKSHERSRSFSDLRFDKKHFLGMIFNKKDSSSKKSQNPPNVPPKNSNIPIIKRANSTSCNKPSAHTNISNKDSDSNPKDTFNGYKIPQFNFNNFIKSNSPIINKRLLRRHSISSMEKSNLEQFYNDNEGMEWKWKKK